MAIRYDFYTVYEGREYRIAEIDGHYEIITNDTDALNLGFIEYKPEENLNPRIFFKIVSSSEIGDVYRIATFAIYKGYEFWIEHETNDGYYILSASTTRQPLLDKLGFTEVERGLFEKKIKKEEANLVYEKKKLITDFFE